MAVAVHGTLVCAWARVSEMQQPKREMHGVVDGNVCVAIADNAGALKHADVLLRVWGTLDVFVLFSSIPLSSSYFQATRRRSHRRSPAAAVHADVQE